MLTPTRSAATSPLTLVVTCPARRPAKGCSRMSWRTSCSKAWREISPCSAMTNLPPSASTWQLSLATATSRCVRDRSYAPTALRVISCADAKAKLAALGKPIGTIYVVSHANAAGEIQIDSPGGNNHGQAFRMQQRAEGAGRECCADQRRFPWLQTGRGNGRNGNIPSKCGGAKRAGDQLLEHCSADAAGHDQRGRTDRRKSDSRRSKRRRSMPRCGHK